MILQKVKNSLEILLDFPLKNLNWKLIFALFFVLCVWSCMAYSMEQARKEQQSKNYTIKIVDEKGDATVLYQNKSVEAANGLIYVCPLGTFSCAKDQHAVILSGNFLIERQD